MCAQAFCARKVRARSAPAHRARLILSTGDKHLRAHRRQGTAGPPGPNAAKKPNRLSVSLTLVVLPMYYGYIGLIAFDKEFLARFLGSGVITLGIPIGVVVIPFTILITAIYIRRANGEC